MSSMTQFLRNPACLATLALIVTMVAAVFCPQEPGPSEGDLPPCWQPPGNSMQAAATTNTQPHSNWFGVVAADLRVADVNALALPQNTRGVLVDGVTAGRLGAAIGIRPDDVIIGVNGHSVVDLRSFSSRIAGTAPGAIVAIDVVRQGRLMRLSAGNAPGRNSFSTAV